MASTKETDSPINHIRNPVKVERNESFAQGHTFPLFPFRPSSTFSRSGARRELTVAVDDIAVKQGVQIRPYGPETPSFAPKFKKSSTYMSANTPRVRSVLLNESLGPADYFPWTGVHPEDVLNESTSKQGSYDKAPVPQNEMSTARPCIWSSLKHKSGSQILSSLYVSAIDHRQAHRTITSKSTFKPPPRVTLTDTKREAWLRDLADPLIPLRRLSRTIPHGIRGKALLEHCLVKNIPISRAVWLAKCVGANEIRAFKRKGASGAFTVGGEEKWIKDWTTNIQLFVETIMGEFENSEWHARMYYW